jgi:hypothetical protein
MLTARVKEEDRVDVLETPQLTLVCSKPLSVQDSSYVEVTLQLSSLIF